MTNLIGQQKGGLQGTDLFFTTEQYTKRLLTTNASFYKKAIHAITKLDVKKKIQNINEEKIFYNPTFKDAKGNTIPINATCERLKAFTYGQIKNQHQLKLDGHTHNRYIANIFTKIAFMENRNNNLIYITNLKKYIKLEQVEHRDIYEELISLKYQEHHSKAKWEERLPNDDLQWPQMWNAMNNHITTEHTKTIIWSQIHLNEYTTYNYNKWHKQATNCPFCLDIPEDNFHIIIDCPILIPLWSELEQTLQNLHPNYITNNERAFGLMGNTPNITLRNWLTFLFRQCIVEQENIAYHNKKGPRNTIDIKMKYNSLVKTEVTKKYYLYKNLGQLTKFEKMFALNNYLIVRQNDQWQILKIFQIT